MQFIIFEDPFSEEKVSGNDYVEDAHKTLYHKHGCTERGGH